MVGAPILDKLGIAFLSKMGIELSLEFFVRRNEQDTTMFTDNPPVDEWAETFDTERIVGENPDRLRKRSDT